jgi:ubiquinone biosynthesis protein
MAEASVCAVIPAKATFSTAGERQPAVLKLVKPGIKENLELELAILDRLALYLEERQQDWGLDNFKFKDTFQQVRWLLTNEIDSTLEQDNIRTAFKYYRHNPNVVIPQVLSCSVSTMTVMSRENGCKITDVGLLKVQQRRLLSQLLARTCILEPIQDLRPTSIFHGDPHAGNIAYRFEKSRPQLVFYDWGMMGRLSRKERFDFSILSLGFLLNSVEIVAHAANNITDGQVCRQKRMQVAINGTVKRLMTTYGGKPAGVLRAVEKLFEELAYKGIVFSNNLFMYEKAQITLKVILKEIDPGFKTDDYLAWVSVGKFLSDLICMRFHLLALEEAWLIYWRYFKQIINLQKQLTRRNLNTQ